MNLLEAQLKAVDLMEYHGKLITNGWYFEFDNAKSRAGSCSFTRNRITLSAPYVELNEWDSVRNTILHEIAHALAGHANGHNSVWRKQALAIGCNGERCIQNVVMPQGKYKGTCPKCGSTCTKHKRMNTACRKCCMQYNGGMYSPDYKLKWSIA